MVADTIELETKRLIDQYQYDEPIRILIEGYDSIFATYKSNRKEPGTATKLYLRPNKNPWEELTNKEFISAVKKAVSKPDVPIKIITDKDTIDYTANDFLSIKAEDLKDFRWNDDDNIKEVNFDFNHDGFQGNAVVTILEKDGIPVSQIDKLSKTIEIDNTKYDLSLEFKYGDNEIKKSGNNISVSDDGQIKSSSAYSSQAHSLSKFSIHGISFSNGLFPDYYNRDKKTMLHWGFPMLLVLDLGGKNDLDLNSARNEIVYDQKWISFEQKLAKVILRSLKDCLETDYWNRFKGILLNMSEVSDNLKTIIKSF